MVLKKVKVIDAQVLDEQEMKRIAGGVSQGEYCATMSMLWNNNWSNWSVGAVEGWWYGWSNHCK
jgi:hypothetical protein